MVITSKEENDESNEVGTGVFWLHISSFAVYNALSLFQREGEPLRDLLLFTIAMALHFTTNDYGLQEHHQEDDQHAGRWVLVSAILPGWGLGFVCESS
ncbi:MAG TPA: hypothetical protein VEC36_08395 [Patescibacteria group bacterium]|nr:hypothetical protein [Patescibacteria group bacterium]